VVCANPACFLGYVALILDRFQALVQIRDEFSEIGIGHSPRAARLAQGQIHLTGRFFRRDLNFLCRLLRQAR
jgi:hypothetical protein